MKLQKEHWGGAEYMLRYQIFAEVLRFGLDNGIIKKNDFFEDDQFVLSKLESRTEKEIAERLRLLRGKINYQITDKNPDYKLTKKFRHIDPKYLDELSIIRLTDSDHSYLKFLNAERKHNQAGIGVKLK